MSADDEILWLLYHVTLATGAAQIKSLLEEGEPKTLTCHPSITIAPTIGG